MQPAHPSAHVPRVVLDTNVCLDWLAFQDPAAAHLALAIAGGQVHLLTCARMRAELGHMLGHASLARWNVAAEAVLACYDSHTTLLPEPLPGAAQRLACSDPDDQVFIDLAVVQRATALLTHDRALLKLARRARAFGVQVLRPRDWCAPGISPDQAPHPAHLQALQPPPPTGR